jgi:hypothetical protein
MAGLGKESEEMMQIDSRVLFIAGFGPIVRAPDASRALYGKALGISFKEEEGNYLHTEALNGAKTFALWPLSQAAKSCFGSTAWPDGLPAPHAWLEFDVESVEIATAELETMGYRMLVKNKKEPWGQIVSRFLDSDGILVGLTFTPSLREKNSVNQGQAIVRGATDASARAAAGESIGNPATLVTPIVSISGVKIVS